MRRTWLAMAPTVAAAPWAVRKGQSRNAASVPAAAFRSESGLVRSPVTTVTPVGSRGRRRVAGQGTDGHARVSQLRRDVTADVSRGSGDEDRLSLHPLSLQLKQRFKSC